MRRYMYDIEDFSTDELRQEILRREEADRNRSCWYCGKNLAAHTCKLAKPSPVPGWEVQPPRFVRDEDCMAREIEYWTTNAKNTTTGRHVIGNADTADASTATCIANINKIYGEG